MGRVLPHHAHRHRALHCSGAQVAYKGAAGGGARDRQVWEAGAPCGREGESEFCLVIDLLNRNTLNWTNKINFLLIIMFFFLNGAHHSSLTFIIVL